MFKNAFYLLFTLIFFVNTSFAAKPLRGMVAVLPGSFKDDGKGREQIILDYIFNDCLNLKYQITSYPFGRHTKDFSDSQYDFVTTVPKVTKLSNFQSKVYIKYTNGVSTRQGLRIKSLADLKGKKVISFKGAKELIPELKEVHKTFGEYTEKAKQDLHTKMLLAQRVDAVISAASIFYAHTQNLILKKEVKMRPMTFHHVLKETDFTMYFKKKSLRDEVNKCIVKMNDEGLMERFRFEFYINELYRSLELISPST